MTATAFSNLLVFQESYNSKFHDIPDAYYTNQLSEPDSRYMNRFSDFSRIFKVQEF